MKIFVDMDEVLADTYSKHLELYNQEFSLSLTKADCHGGEAWENVPEARRESVFRHMHTPGFFRSLDPIPGSQKIMKLLCERHEVYVASAAMEFPQSLKEKSDWLDEHFPFVHWRNRILCGDKHVLKGDLLIDDRMHNLEHFEGRTIMFTSPHNVHVKGCERVDNWDELGRLLLEPRLVRRHLNR